MLIINLTQHQATPEQHKAGVMDLPLAKRLQLAELLTFVEIPTKEELQERAKAIVDLACDNGLGLNGADPMPEMAMIGGAPFFMPYLEEELEAAFIIPTYAFSKSVVQEAIQPKGTVIKTAVFQHIGFVDV